MINTQKAIEIVTDELAAAPLHGQRAAMLADLLEYLKTVRQLVNATDALNPQCLSLGAGTMANIKHLSNLLTN